MARQGRLDTDAPLLDGHERPIGDEPHAWTGAVGSAITMTWTQPVAVGGVRMVFDSNLNHDKRMPCSYPQKGDRVAVPGTLLRGYRLEVRGASGQWRTVYREESNHQRLVNAPVGAETDAVRLVLESTWGHDAARVFTFEPTTTCRNLRPAPNPRVRWKDVVATIDPADLAAPEHGLEEARTRYAGA